MEGYIEIGSKLEAREKSMYFRLGAELDGRFTVKYGFRPSQDYIHEKALAALTAIDFESMKAARAIVNVTRMI